MDARGTEKTGDGKVTATIKSPSGKKVNNFVENKNDGTYKVTYILPEEGTFWLILVLFLMFCFIT